MKQLFSFQGQVGRRFYFFASVIVSIVFSILVGVVGSGSSDGNLDTDPEGFETSFHFSFEATNLPSLIIFIAQIWILLALSVKRCRDANIHPGFCVLLMFTGPLFWLFLCFYPSVKSEATSTLSP